MISKKKKNHHEIMMSTKQKYAKMEIPEQQVARGCTWLFSSPFSHDSMSY